MQKSLYLINKSLKIALDRGNLQKESEQVYFDKMSNQLFTLVAHKTKKFMRNALVLTFLAFTFCYIQSNAQSDSIPEPYVSETNHSINIDGRTINYKASAGTLLLRDEKNEPIALYGYTAYTKSDVKEVSQRPILFAYNGGPGSSSIWLHLGVLGPKRTVVNDPGFTPASPYQLEDNNYSILDIADLVMVDPVGTGISKAIGAAENKDFWGVDQDIRTVSQFIKQFINEHDRWTSPKYILGESYGTMRSAGVVNYLQERLGVAVNGVIMVSAVFDLRTITFYQGDDISYIVNLPTYAACAYYHDKVPNKPEDLDAFIQSSREFAQNEYASALMKGDQLTPTEKMDLGKKLAYFTGLDETYLEMARYRVSLGEFAQELLRDERKTIGRLDCRFKGINQDPLTQNMMYDAQSSAISPAYKTTFLDYYYNQLGMDKSIAYNFSAGDGHSDFEWDWKHRKNGIGGWPRGVNTGVDLAEAMSRNPNLKVLVLNGYHDLATPFNAVEYTIDHLGLEPEVKANIQMEYYEAGHMMYTHQPSLVKFKKDLAGFIKETLAKP